ncbi:chitin binding Peritrophin-A [Elysia marginata]|uniref:Chitin binding Peritrophin-A n=1 Tax=Elysia marginata TaxID=1093978 RepID=A0AAV4IJ71_9GAST|nr:chitin binding Peritrophin-A [Elysia marginata]
MSALRLVVALALLVTLAESLPREKRQAKQQQYQPPAQQYQPPQQQYQPPQQQYQPPQQKYQPPQQQYQPKNPPQTGGTFRCPQPNGQFPYTQDCTKFYRCDNSVATVTDCQPQLVFNPKTNMCDWPSSVPTCRNTQKIQMLKPEIGDLCASNPYGGKPGETFHMRHPGMCNAFFTCTQGFTHGLCSFCPDGAYFNKFAGGCRTLPAGIRNTAELCENLPMIQESDKAKFSVSEVCWPFANIQNPWESLAKLFGMKLPYNPSYQNQQQQQYRPPQNQQQQQQQQQQV